MMTEVNGKPKISTSLFTALTCDFADWLMLSNLGDKQYKSLLVTTDGSQSFNDEGQDIYNDWNDDVEQALHTYFDKED